MKTATPQFSRRTRGFTLVEVMTTMSVAMLGMGLATSTFMTSLRTMFRDNQRLETNANLRYVVAHLSKETLDASDFYLFADYRKLDGSIDVDADASPSELDAYGADVRHGDCLVLVTRVTIEASSNIRQIRIYYRDVASPNSMGGLRYYKSADYGTSGTATPLNTLLNGINLNASPAFTGTQVIADTTRGRRRAGSQTECYPIFSSDTATPARSNEAVSINVEVVNGNTTLNLLSSSSFNYTISPRR